MARAVDSLKSVFGHVKASGQMLAAMRKRVGTSEAELQRATEAAEQRARDAEKAIAERLRSSSILLLSKSMMAMDQKKHKAMSPEECVEAVRAKAEDVVGQVCDLHGEWPTKAAFRSQRGAVARLPSGGLVQRVIREDGSWWAPVDLHLPKKGDRWADGVLLADGAVAAGAQMLAPSVNIFSGRLLVDELLKVMLDACQRDAAVQAALISANATAKTTARKHQKEIETMQKKAKEEKETIRVQIKHINMHVAYYRSRCMSLEEENHKLKKQVAGLVTRMLQQHAAQEMRMRLQIEQQQQGELLLQLKVWEAEGATIVAGIRAAKQRRMDRAAAMRKAWASTASSRDSEANALRMVKEEAFAAARARVASEVAGALAQALEGEVAQLRRDGAALRRQLEAERDDSGPLASLGDLLRALPQQMGASAATLFDPSVTASAVCL